MNEVEKYLVRSRKTIVQICEELGIEIEDVKIENIDQCSSCSIWLKFNELKKDLDDNPIYKHCWMAYGD